MLNTKMLLSASAAMALSYSSLSVAIIGAGVIGDSLVSEAQAATVLHQGVWTKKTFKVSGSWSIVEKDGATFVVLSDDFKTRGAPDLKIFLSPQSASSAKGNNATSGSVLISALSSNKGGQMYQIPANVDVSAYSSILIHCEAYSKLWAAADL